VLERLPLLDVTDAAITLAAALVSGQALPAQAAQDAGQSHQVCAKIFNR
jgi:hypothetical protein